MRRPRFIAEQARNAKGVVGRIVAAIMARETWDKNRRAIEAIEVKERDCVLDIGCGHGRSLTALAALARKGRVVGVDPSELMAEIAVRRNRGLVRARSVEVRIATADALPFPDAAFDKAMCVHVVYFWTGLDAALREIARVLTPGAQLALVFSTDANKAAVRTFPTDVYRFPALDEMVAALEMAGFAVDLPGDISAEQHSAPVLLVAVKRSQPESTGASA